MDSNMKWRAILFSLGAILLVVCVTCMGNPSLRKRIFSGGEESGAQTDSSGKGTEEESEPENAGGYVKDGFAGADKALQIGDDLRAFLRDATFFDKELESYEKRLLAADEKSLLFVVTSVQRDLRVQILDSAANLVTGVPFVLHLKEEGNFVDQDKDGVIYIGNLNAGEYELTLAETEGFEAPKPTVVSVKEQVERTAIQDIALLMRTEADIQAEVEDTEENGAVADADDTEVMEIKKLGEEGQIGIDVSSRNGEIDWDRVKNAGIRFAVIRCGYRGSLTGALVEDSNFRKNIQGALAAGLKVGVYFFSQATNEVEAVEEASMALALSREYKLTYPIFIDSESAGGEGRADLLDMETRTKICQAFCETVEDAGYTGGVYGGRMWFRTKLRMDMLTEQIIWLAEYRKEPIYGGSYHFWKYTSSGSVDGIEGTVGLDIGYLAY